MLTLFEIRNALADGVSIFDLHLKVTYYARVSTDKYDQLNSLENQITYYEHFIRENTNLLMVTLMRELLVLQQLNVMILNV